MIKKRSPSRATPFANLSPEVVLDAQEFAGLPSDGRLFALNSYENRVYRLTGEEAGWVLKFYRPGRWTDRQIREEHAFALELAAQEMNVAAPIRIRRNTLLSHRGFRFAIFPLKAGRAPELDAPGARALLGRAIGRLHRVGAAGSFEVRPSIDIDRLGHRARASILKSPLLPTSLKESYARASGVLLERVEQAFEGVGALKIQRIHGDCHLGNILWDEQGPVFVDLDDCAMGPAIQDLWMLLAGAAAEQQKQWQELLDGYQQFADFDFRELLIIEPLRALRMIHHAAWIAQRWQDPAFPRAFPELAEMRFWESHIGDLLEQRAAIDAPPLLCT